ncbi:unnamed protein product, partial [Rotaria sp. Silwood2]
CDPTHNPSI